MTTVTHDTPRTGFTGWILRIETWLDDKGTPAWIAVLVLTLILAWPLGLALLAYMIWSRKMTCTSRRSTSGRHSMSSTRPSGNSAFDAYRETTLRRLEEEQQTFEAFLARLRAARDKAEFYQFMEELAGAAANTEETDPNFGRA
ncbi:DUF2852 domain-containing protein [Roseovarius aestuariivivens]|uniref:DUF2852 domain-containing protein n=1 Tax=Roseovarius aestuariivivens TaxID=1888910 RepID=UPI001080ADD2|nr:DUF2852 domain-containing protein [Roseovarius aestuariivivens]